MTAVELSPTLVSRLGILEAHVLDVSISEVLVAGPGRIYATRNGETGPLDVPFDETAIRSLASRLSRALVKQDNGSRTGLIAPELHASLIGTPRGERCPVIRFVRRAIPRATLSQLAEQGVLDRDGELRLLEACRTRRSVLICGHPGSGRTELLAALARIWREERRVVVLDPPDGRLGASAIGHVTLDPESGAEGALLVGAEVIVADEPRAPLWGELLTLGRPFVASQEAVDAQAALDRLVTHALCARSDTSEIAAMAMVESSVGMIVEMERSGPRVRVRSIAETARSGSALVARHLMRPEAEPQTPRFTPPLGPPLSRLPDTPSQPGRALSSLASIPPDKTANHLVSDGDFESAELSEIRAESLMSASFVGRLDEADPALADPEEPTRHPDFSAVEETPDIKFERDTDAAEEDDDATPELGQESPSGAVRALRRSASERTPTIIGPEGPPALGPEATFGDEDSGELKTAAKAGLNVPKQSTIPDGRPQDEMTMHAEASEMVAEDLYPSQTLDVDEDATIVPDEGEWDHESPSEIMDDEPYGRGFADEKTPYASMVENDRISADEIEGMLNELDELENEFGERTNSEDDDDELPKPKRSRRVR